MKQSKKFNSTVVMCVTTVCTILRDACRMLTAPLIKYTSAVALSGTYGKFLT